MKDYTTIKVDIEFCRNKGDFNDFLQLREELIKEDKSIAWDISKLRKEIFRKKLSHVNPIKLRNEIVESAFDIFISFSFAFSALIPTSASSGEV